jgi:ParB/RepB/Spo0J family partition protein
MDILTLDQIFPNPDQPRKHFHQGKLEELAQSIKASGLMEPLIVVPRGDLYMIIAGERRWRACGIAGVTEVPVRILDVDDRKVAELSLLENLQREDLNLIEEAKAYQGLINMGLTQTELAEKMGIMQEWRIQERLNLLKLSDTYQDCVAKGILSPSQGQEISRVPQEKQRFVFDMISSGKAGSYNKLRALVNAIVAAEVQSSFLPEPTAQEIAVKNKYDQIIEKLVGFLTHAFNRDDMGVLSKVLAGSTKVNIEKIDLIIGHLNKIKKAMIKADSTQEVLGLST